MHARRISLIIFIVLIASACGGSSGVESISLSPEQTAVADKLTETFGVERFSDEQNDCVGAYIVDDLGADELATIGVTADEFTESANLNDNLRTSYYSAIVECLDMRAFLKDSDTSGQIRDCWLDAMSEQSLAVMVLIASTDNFQAFGPDAMRVLTEESDAAEQQC